MRINHVSLVQHVLYVCIWLKDKVHFFARRGFFMFNQQDEQDIPCEALSHICVLESPKPVLHKLLIGTV